MDHEWAGTDRCTRMSRPGRAAGPAPASNATTSCAPASSNVSVGGGRPSRLPATWPKRQGRTVISYESIYRFIYAQAARHKNHAWRRYLPRAKWKRGRRRRKGSSSASFIAHRRPVAERPAAAADRQRFGHWEADLMLFGRSGPVLLVLQERRSRLLLMMRARSKAAGPIAETIARVLGPLPPALRQTITFDNGTEFARHHELHDLGIETFFCDTYAPWQKGGVENAIGRLRRFLPRKMNLAEVPEVRFTEVALAYNNTPRKCLGYRSSAEIFKTSVLHFKCESTFPAFAGMTGAGERRGGEKRYVERGAGGGGDGGGGGDAGSAAAAKEPGLAPHGGAEAGLPGDVRADGGPGLPDWTQWGLRVGRCRVGSVMTRRSASCSTRRSGWSMHGRRRRPRPRRRASVTAGERKRLFLDEFARVGTVTGACDRAGVTLQKFEQWTKSSKRFRARYEEAKLRFHDRIEQKIMEQINKGKNVGLLRFKAQGELPEKYGRAGKQTPAKGKSGMTWDDLERIVEESNDEATRH